MKRWHVWIAGTLLGLLLLFAQKYHNATLAGARQVAAQAVVAAQEAIDSALVWEARAKAAEQRARAAQARRQAAEPQTAVLIAESPEACKPAIEALQAGIADAVAEAKHWQEAFEEQKQATAALTPAIEDLTEAADNLVDKSGGFWRDITPKIGVGAAAGISPISGRFDVIIGPTLNWSF
jgi:hypothetical protein